MKTKELKITDVMVGDLVDVRNDAAPNTKHLEKITPAHLFRDEHWYGIPLTPEILEKNGFHEKWDKDIKLMACDNITIEIGDNYKLYEDGKMYLRRVLAPLYYVHELQHALKLCGIEKDITINKED